MAESSAGGMAAAVSVLPEVLELKDEMFANRRWFHANPELSFEEERTAAKVVEHLRSYGITEIWEQVGRTGVIALIRGEQSGRCCALRADMDALPVTETADIPYRSQNPGVMHACGHDGHMTSLLATAKILMANRHRIKGVVKLVFQPAEEGFGGAKEMITDGCLEEGPQGPRVDSIYGIHLWSPLKLSHVACKDGPMMASSDKFEIDVLGSGGHGAMPQGTVDAIVEAAHLVTSLQTIVSRNKSPMENGVVTCGTISGGYGHNIIADKVTITGTARSFTPEVQDLIKSRMECICCGVGATFGGKINLNYDYGYPPTVNSYPECVQIVKAATRKVIGANDDAIEPLMTMGAEDFSYFLNERPGCFFFVGAALPGEVRPHHKSVFDFDENAMLISASIFLEIIYSVLS